MGLSDIRRGPSSEEKKNLYPKIDVDVVGAEKKEK